MPIDTRSTESIAALRSTNADLLKALDELIDIADDPDARGDIPEQDEILDRAKAAAARARGMVPEPSVAPDFETWRVVNDIEIADGMELIATLERSVHLSARAKLIVAAPELLDALGDCAGVIQSIEDQLKGKSVAVTAVLEKARSAIAKVGGRES